MTYQCTEESFLKDVKNHHMTVIRDDGVCRHVQFKQPGTNCYRFDFITWPGYLCYTGDMGTYVFSRLEDMFEFFRTDRKQPKEGQTLFINLGYWAEKLQAIDRDGVKEYSPDKFREAINRYMEDDERVTPEIRQAVEDEVLAFSDEGEHEASRAVYEFEHDGYCFVDFFEATLTEYTYRFIWCCYAIAWGINKYDQQKEREAA